MTKTQISQEELNKDLLNLLHDTAHDLNIINYYVDREKGNKSNNITKVKESVKALKTKLDKFYTKYYKRKNEQ